MTLGLCPRAKGFFQREERTFLLALQTEKTALEQEGICLRPVEQVVMEAPSR